jgi:L-amino acid N-acyltransferase YncA
MATDIQIRSASEADADGIRDALKAIAAKKRYLATLDGFSLQETRAFLKHLAEAGLPEIIATADKKVIGFCDVSPNSAAGFTHLGRLGMGVRAEWRRQGIGRLLLNACLAQARKVGIEKIELEVFSDNTGAVKMYESFGFNREGVRAGVRKLEGRYQDLVLMALNLLPRAAS